MHIKRSETFKNIKCHIPHTRNIESYIAPYKKFQVLNFPIHKTSNVRLPHKKHGISPRNLVISNITKFFKIPRSQSNSLIGPEMIETPPKIFFYEKLESQIFWVRDPQD